MTVKRYRRLVNNIVVSIALFASSAIPFLLLFYLSNKQNLLDKRIWQTVVLVMSFGGAALVSTAWLLFGISAVLIAFWRCPNCGHRFQGFLGGWPGKLCRNCGISLSELERREEVLASRER